MFRWVYFHGALLFYAGPLVAQAPTRPTDPVFVRAQALVSDGNGTAGRALIDSVIAVTSPTARLYPEALFWRASLASNAADAESDYKHIVVDYPLAPQAEAALLRLAQLELARGDRESALLHLQRIPRDYPRSKSLARASYWTARVFFEKNDVSNACVANANALAQAGPEEIELRNQIQYQGQRCPISAAAVTTVVKPTSDATRDNSIASSTASSASSTTVSLTAPKSSTRPTPTSATPVRDTSPTVPEKVASRDTMLAAPASLPKTIDQNQRLKPPAEARDTKPSIVDPTKSPANVGAKSPANAGEKAPAISVAAASSSTAYSVQVAAYTRKPDADKLASTLAKRGHQARVDGSVAPFRVRIGRYATIKEAEDALRGIKAKQMDGFVVRAPER